MNIFVSASSQEHVSLNYDNVLLKIAGIINKYNDTLCVGGNIGSMKLLLENTNNNRIVINELCKNQIIGHDNVTLTENSFDRTANIVSSNDMYVIMPGSIGSVSELLTILESKRSDNNTNVLVLINLENYYDTLLNFLNETYEKGFIKERIDKYLYVINNIDELEKIRRNM